MLMITLHVKIINEWHLQDATEAISRFLFNLQFKPITSEPK